MVVGLELQSSAAVDRHWISCCDFRAESSNNWTYVAEWDTKTSLLLGLATAFLWKDGGSK